LSYAPMQASMKSEIRARILSNLGE